ncbi:hypothetical protein ACIP5Y_19205 [Nocardia sp. NPDC088792]|uniref:hypothetical protein n=1 Tax=Nocardia sp. NPDC088792 TaxID=3364332 RepID=UPI0038076711
MTLAAATGVLLSLTACGQSDKQPATTGPTVPTVTAAGFSKDPCSLLTSAELTPALGGAATPAPGVNALGLHKCDWTRPDENLPEGIPDLSLSYFSAATSKAFADAIHQHLPPAADERQLAIGDGAVLKTDNSIIDVLVGNSVFRLTGYSQHPLSDDTLTSLATAAAERLA